MKDISLRDILLFSPYDNKFKTREISQEEYRKEIFFEVPEFADEKINLDAALDPNSNQQRNINILYGYSGNGKNYFY